MFVRSSLHAYGLRKSVSTYSLIQLIFFLWLYDKTWTNAEATVTTVTKVEYVQIAMEVIAVSVPTDTAATVELV